MTNPKDTQREAGTPTGNRRTPCRPVLLKATEGTDPSQSYHAPPAIPVLLTEAQVADGLNISPRTLQQWRYKGGGPRYSKVGSAVRYRPEDVAAWLAQQTRCSTADPGPDAA